MRGSSLPDNFEIAPGYRIEDWRNLALEDANQVTPDWDRAITIFNKRIRSRFLQPVQQLIDSEKKAARGTNGFAILAIDFLLIETIQGIRRGLTSHQRQSKKLFKEFLLGWHVFNRHVPASFDASTLAGDLYEQGRCALHHTGATDRLLVRKSKAIFVFHLDGRIEINRTKFHAELVKVFDSYLADLKAPPNSALRENFRNKMTHICS